MFRPFGPQFGPKIRWGVGGGGAVPTPLLNPPRLFKLEYFGNKKRDSGNRLPACTRATKEIGDVCTQARKPMKKVSNEIFFAEKDLVFPDAEHRPLCTQRRNVCNMDHPIDRRTLTKKRLLKY